MISYSSFFLGAWVMKLACFYAYHYVVGAEVHHGCMYYLEGTSSNNDSITWCWLTYLRKGPLMNFQSDDDT